LVFSQLPTANSQQLMANSQQQKKNQKVGNFGRAAIGTGSFGMVAALL